MIQEKNKFQLQDFFIIFIASALLATGLQGALLHGAPGLLENRTARLFLSMWPQDLLFLAGVVLCVHLRHERWQHVGLRPMTGRHPLVGSVLVGAGLYVLMLVFIQLLNRLLPGGLAEQNVQVYMQAGDAWPHRVAVLVTLGVLAPLAEELLFRGVLFQSFCNHLPVNTAMIFTSLVFACTHFDFQRFLPLAVGGYLLNLVAVRYKSVLASAVSHGTWNCLMLLIFYMTN